MTSREVLLCDPKMNQWSPKWSTMQTWNGKQKPLLFRLEMQFYSTRKKAEQVFSKIWSDSIHSNERNQDCSLPKWQVCRPKGIFAQKGEHKYPPKEGSVGDEDDSSMDHDLSGRNGEAITKSIIIIGWKWKHCEYPMRNHKQLNQYGWNVYDSLIVT